MFPTLCELAGVALPETDGISQVPVIDGKRDNMRDYVVGFFRDSQRMIRTTRWKWIEYPLVDQFQLFDLVEDPFELNNLVDDPAYERTKHTLAQQLAAWLANATAKQQ